MLINTLVERDKEKARESIHQIGICNMYAPSYIITLFLIQVITTSVKLLWY